MNSLRHIIFKKKNTPESISTVSITMYVILNTRQLFCDEVVIYFFKVPELHRV